MDKSKNRAGDRGLGEAKELGPRGRQQVADLFALGRIGVPEDTGSVVAFLCTEEASWVMAQRIEVSGGMLL